MYMRSGTIIYRRYAVMTSSTNWYTHVRSQGTGIYTVDAGSGGVLAMETKDLGLLFYSYNNVDSTYIEGAFRNKRAADTFSRGIQDGILVYR